jgi:hypothetical protein
MFIDWPLGGRFLQLKPPPRECEMKRFYPFSMTALARAVVKKPVVDAWSALENHFQHRAKLVSRFRRASRRSIVRMWRSQTNEDGNPFSEFEPHALIERHCELFDR